MDRPALVLLKAERNSYFKDVEKERLKKAHLDFVVVTALVEEKT